MVDSSPVVTERAETKASLIKCLSSFVLQTLLGCSIATLCGAAGVKHTLPGRPFLGAVVSVPLTCTKMFEEGKALPDDWGSG